jgi:hypothetical protein
VAPAVPNENQQRHLPISCQYVAGSKNRPSRSARRSIGCGSQPGPDGGPGDVDALARDLRELEQLAGVPAPSE